LAAELRASGRLAVLARDLHSETPRVGVEGEAVE